MATLSLWNDIPDIALIYVYKHLKNKDRLNVSLACKNWNRIFFSSSLWRERRVAFDCMWPERRAELEKKYIDKFGHCLSKLSIMIGQPSIKSCMSISKAVESYMKHICGRNDIHLRELDLEHLHFEQNWHFILSRNRLTTALCRMLRKQKCLESVYMSGARMRIFDGCRVLEALAKGFTGRTITNLYMEDFFEMNVFPFRQQRFITVMSKFHALDHLHINYRYINSDILRNFANALPHCLQSISMILDGDIRGIEIPSEVWYEFSSRCPRVKVNIYLCTTILRGNDLLSPFVREMPLVECYLTSYTRLDEREDRIGQLLYHLGSLFSSTLENFAMFFERHEPLDGELLFLLRKCRQLKDLCIQCRLDAVTVIDIMRLLRGRSIVSINLTIPGLTDDDWQRIEEQKSRLIPNDMEFVHIGPNEFGSSIGGSTSTVNEEEDEDPDVFIMAANNLENAAGNQDPEAGNAQPEDVVIVISDEDGSEESGSDDSNEGLLI